jgi:hypothetical protein
MKHEKGPQDRSIPTPHLYLCKKMQVTGLIVSWVSVDMIHRLPHSVTRRSVRMLQECVVFCFGIAQTTQLEGDDHTQARARVRTKNRL